jgi:tripartite-type tricarboxylate transporter receptor subunit TctC
VNWCAFFAPAGTPEAMVGRLNAALARTLSDPEIRDRLLAVGMESAPSTPQFLDKFLRDEFTLWQRVITTANIKPE